MEKQAKNYEPKNLSQIQQGYVKRPVIILIDPQQYKLGRNITYKRTNIKIGNNQGFIMLCEQKWNNKFNGDFKEARVIISYWKERNQIFVKCGIYPYSYPVFISILKTLNKDNTLSKIVIKYDELKSQSTMLLSRTLANIVSKQKLDHLSKSNEVLYNQMEKGQSIKFRLRKQDKYDEYYKLNSIKKIETEQNQKNKQLDSSFDGSEQKTPRPKERRISHIIEKVFKWRQYYSGYYDKDGVFKQCDLQKAATKVGMSKKSLDDYLLQIRKGSKLGFDFGKNKKSKVGVLRSYVKKHGKGLSSKKLKSMALNCKGLTPKFKAYLTNLKLPKNYKIPRK